MNGPDYEQPAARRALPDTPRWELAWLRVSLERSAAQARANGFPGTSAYLENVLDALPDTPNPPEHV